MGCLRVCSVSGGKDSTALYLWMLEQFGAGGFKAVMADTGHEHPVTMNYVRNLHGFACGPTVEIVKADFTERLKKRGVAPSGTPFLDMLLWKKMMPSGNRQFCTSHLKLEPIRDWMEAQRGDREVTLYLGIRAEESARRAKLPMVEHSDFYDCVVMRPLLDWKEAQVFAKMAEHKVEPNPLYANGMSRVGCFPCINANKKDLRNLPDWAWEKIAGWEKALGVPWFGPRLVPGNPKPSIEDVRAWSKTLHGGKKMDLEAYDVDDVPSCMSTWGVCQ